MKKRIKCLVDSETWQSILDSDFERYRATPAEMTDALSIAEYELRKDYACLLKECMTAFNIIAGCKIYREEWAMEDASTAFTLAMTAGKIIEEAQKKLEEHTTRYSIVNL